MYENIISIKQGYILYGEIYIFYFKHEDHITIVTRKNTTILQPPSNHSRSTDMSVIIPNSM